MLFEPVVENDEHEESNVVEEGGESDDEQEEDSRGTDVEGEKTKADPMSVFAGCDEGENI